MESAEFPAVSHDVSSVMSNKLGIPVFELFELVSQFGYPRDICVNVDRESDVRRKAWLPVSRSEHDTQPPPSNCRRFYLLRSEVRKSESVYGSSVLVTGRVYLYAVVLLFVYSWRDDWKCT